MHTLQALDQADKTTFYVDLEKQLAAVLEGERNLIANAANVSALIYEMVPNLNWAGFYLMKANNELVLGPFQGKVACVRIPVGKGVCGAAAERRETMLVMDVHEFPGHIACDANSRSELVVPIMKNGEVMGVLDLDSPIPGRFDDEDRIGFEKIVSTFIGMTDFV